MDFLSNVDKALLKCFLNCFYYQAQNEIRRETFVMEVVWTCFGFCFDVQLLKVHLEVRHSVDRSSAFGENHFVLNVCFFLLKIVLVPANIRVWKHTGTFGLLVCEYGGVKATLGNIEPRR